MVGQSENRGSEGKTVGRLDGRTVGRPEGDTGAGTLGRSDSREVGEKVNLEQGQLDGWEVGKVTLEEGEGEVDNRKGRRRNGEENPQVNYPGCWCLGDVYD